MGEGGVREWWWEGEGSGGEGGGGVIEWGHTLQIP